MYVIILTKPFKAGHSGTACHLILDIRDFTRYHEKLVIYPPFPSLSRGYTLCIVSLFMATKKAPAGDPEPYSVLQLPSVR